MCTSSGPVSDFLPRKSRITATACRTFFALGPSARPAEKLGKLRQPGFHATPLRLQLFGFLLVADPPQCGQQISKGGFLLLPVPGTVGETQRQVAA